MDSEQFGQMTKALAAGTDRRRVLRGLALGAAASALALVSVDGASAKRPENPGNSNGKGKGRGRTRVGVCHRRDDGTYKYLSLPEPAARAHSRHGDAINVDLTSDGANCGTCGNACVAPDICTVASCTDGACTTTPVVCEDDGNECTMSTCDPNAGGCTTTAVLDGQSCGTAGSCQAGVCQEPPAA